MKHHDKHYDTGPVRHAIYVGRYRSALNRRVKWAHRWYIQITVKVSRQKMLRTRVNRHTRSQDVEKATAFIERTRRPDEPPAEEIVAALLYPEMEQATREGLAQ